MPFTMSAHDSQARRRSAVMSKYKQLPSSDGDNAQDEYALSVARIPRHLLGMNYHFRFRHAE